MGIFSDWVFNLCAIGIIAISFLYFSRKSEWMKTLNKKTEKNIFLPVIKSLSPTIFLLIICCILNITCSIGTCGNNENSPFASVGTGIGVSFFAIIFIAQVWGWLNISKEISNIRIVPKTFFIIIASLLTLLLFVKLFSITAFLFN